jgi:hypothetical protein
MIVAIACGLHDHKRDGTVAMEEEPLPLASERKQVAMNRCLAEIGCRFPNFTDECIALGERLSRLDRRRVPKGCTSTHTPDWIAAVLEREKSAPLSTEQSPQSLPGLQLHHRVLDHLHIR